jgi:hypothetical protein
MRCYYWEKVMDIKQARAKLTEASRSTGTKHAKILVADLCSVMKFVLDEIERIDISFVTVSKLEPLKINMNPEIDPVVPWQDRPTIHVPEYVLPEIRDENAGDAECLGGMMAKDNFLKLQVSNGLIKDKQGKTVALVWTFRPDIVTADKFWFEAKGRQIDEHLFGVEIGSDGYPTRGVKMFVNSDGPDEWEQLPDEEIIEIFQLCCKLLSKIDTEESNMQKLGKDILDEMLSSGEK